MKSTDHELLRTLPSVTALLEDAEIAAWLEVLPRGAVVAAVQDAIQAFREKMASGEIRQPVDVDEILSVVEEQLLGRSHGSLRRVINATGIVLHTGLGRAPLCEAALDAIVDGASGYCNLEYDLESGRRGHRSDHIRRELAEATGAEDATVVNNNAAATLLLLKVLAAGREVIVSRGQLIEIGGSYRLPDIMSASGAMLREVGTTNRTRLRDYENAINERSAMLLRVHTSNYRVMGFTEETPLDQLVELGAKTGIPVVDDLGSGSLIDLTRLGLPAEPFVRDSVRAGCDAVCFSGDKLLGGPQCGIIVGKNETIARIERDPLFRTYRVDKLTLLALSATLRHFSDPEDARANIPALTMLSQSTDELAARADSLVRQLAQGMPDERFYVCSDVSFAGGGSLPTEQLPTVVVQWRPLRTSAENAAAELRLADPPVIARIRDDAVCFDLRTLREMDLEPLVSAVTGLEWDEEPDEGNISLPIL